MENRGVLLPFLCASLGALFFSSSATSQEWLDLDFFSQGQGMHLSPGIINKFDGLRSALSGTRTDQKILKKLADRWGIQSYEQKLVGIKTVNYQGMKIGVLGCVACHSGKAAGHFIVGIGNKNIDPGQIGMDGVAIEKLTKNLHPVSRALNPARKAIEDSSLRLMKKLADPRLSASAQGLVPVSLVGSWFYEVAGKPLPQNGFKGAVKVPAWFGFQKKIEVGQFADAIGKGHPPGWIIGVEVTAGQSPEVIRGYFPKVEHTAELISQLTPPKYPFLIRSENAARGKFIFKNRCVQCHGNYENDASGKPLEEIPEIVSVDTIGTDTDRLDYVTEDFLNQVRSSPLADLLQPSEYAGKRMYVAPRLHAIWARFPYLHNASVPTLRDLLEPANRRPKVFSLKDAGEAFRFDRQRMGLTQTVLPKNKKARWIYSTDLQGQSNRGHEKGVDLSSSQKNDLLEYLKTL